jgi:hypothetical protein
LRALDSLAHAKNHKRMEFWAIHTQDVQVH